MITRNFKKAMVRALGQRGERAYQAARLIAENEAQLLAAAGGISPKLKTAVIAIAEFAGFIRDIEEDFDAMIGHLSEDAEIARAHATDMANVATLAKSLPGLMDAEVRMAPYVIDPGDLGTMQQAINLIAYEVQAAAQSTYQGKRFKVGVVIKAAE